MTHTPKSASPPAAVRAMYDATAEGYASVMDAELDLPVYDEVLGRLAATIEGVDGTVLDSSCGSGHMLARYRDRFDAGRPLAGIDLSPAMVALTSARVPTADVRVGDMRDHARFGDQTIAGIISFYALHHLTPDDAAAAIHTWHDALTPGGALLVATWEGTGPIDYGGHTDLVAFRYTVEQVRRWAESAGFAIDRCKVLPVEGLPMDGVLLEARRR